LAPPPAKVIMGEARLGAKLKRKVSAFSRYAPVHYTRTAAAVAYQRMTGNYPPDYRADRLPLRADLGSYEHLFEDSVANLRIIVGPCRGEFRWFLGKIYNRYFSSVDVELYYSVIRSSRPQRIVEIGSGMSTRFALDALRKNGRGGIVSIDPEPRRRLPHDVRHLRMQVQEVDLGLFQELGPGDILFIDSSHTTEEAHYHVERILPTLAGGVLVHHHDFLFPYEKYYEDDPQTYGEQEVLLEFYSANTDQYHVMVSASFVTYSSPQTLRQFVPSYRWFPMRVPGSLWTRKEETRAEGSHD
jgi:predicted O-methyltransferase YrrM